MLEGNGLIILISPITGLLSLLIGAYLLTQGRERPETRIAFMLIFTLTAGSMVDFFFGIAPDETTALWLGRILIFFAEVTMGTFLVLTLLQMPEPYKGRVMARRVHLLLAVSSVALLSSLTIDKVMQDSYGWSISTSFGLNLSILIYLIYIVTCISALTWACMRSDDRQYRMKVTLLSFAVSMPLIYGIISRIIEMFVDLEFPRLLMPGFTMMVVLMAFAMWKYRLFIQVPAVRESSPLKTVSPVAKTQLGKSYLVEARRADMAYELLLDDLAKGSHGLVITREHPDIVKERRGLSNTPILWLTSQPGRDRIDPTNLSILQHTIIEHLRNAELPVILFDGLEYLLANNKQEKVVQLVLIIRDEIIVNNGKLIILVDPRTLDPRTLAFFERDLEVVVNEPSSQKFEGE